MASTRLPGKVMKRLGNKRAIGWAVNAAMRAPGVDAVVVATSTNPENDTIAEWCTHNGVMCFRGSEEDVLDRFCQIIESYQPHDVLRLTADCPLLDSHVIGDLIALHRGVGSVYTTNQWPPTWPDGLDCEIVQATALLEAGREATSQIDRDTVTQYVWRNQSRWPASNLTCPLPLEKERWVLDSPEDYELLKRIVEYFPDDWEPKWQDIWHFLNKYPELRETNKTWWRNQRFYEGLVSEGEKTRNYTRTAAHLKRASEVIPCASQTFSKSCLSFPGSRSPLFASHGNGAYIFDIDGHRYVDLVGALLPVVLGYTDPDVDYAVRRQLDKGISLSLATELETTLAETLVELIPCAEMVRFGKNGSDATSGAVRLARAYTNRAWVGIVQVGEGYHGWHDWAVAKTPRDNGVPSFVKYLTHRIEPTIHDLEKKLYLHEFAAIIIDPENHTQEFLSQLQRLCRSRRTVLIFDEIRTGFRYSLGGYQQYVGVTPDLACFGKSMANGMPISALVGKKELMQGLGADVFWSGTFFGETLSLAAAKATIDKMKREPVLTHLSWLGNTLRDEVRHILGRAGRKDIVVKGSHFRPYLEFECAECRQAFIRDMANQGVLILNSHNTCYAMGENELHMVLDAYKKVLQ